MILWGRISFYFIRVCHPGVVLLLHKEIFVSEKNVLEILVNKTENDIQPQDMTIKTDNFEVIINLF